MCVKNEGATAAGALSGDAVQSRSNAGEGGEDLLVRFATWRWRKSRSAWNAAALVSRRAAGHPGDASGCTGRGSA